MNDLIRGGVCSFCASPGLRAAIVRGIVDPSAATVSVAFYCPKGNCTFQAQLGVTSSSIAYCSACDDMTESIEEVSLGPEKYTPYPDLSSSCYCRVSVPPGTNIYVQKYDADARMSVGSFVDDDATSGFGIIAFTLAGCLIPDPRQLGPDSSCKL